MSRSLNRQILFEEEIDYIKYLDILSKAKEKFGFKIYAYCLMTNHIHMLIEDKKNNLSNFMKQINHEYAMYYNKKYDRLGYVFADRFKSENIENEKYFNTCLRYIHQNPVKALITDKTYEYKFSSIHAYRRMKGNYLNLVDTSVIFKRYDKGTFLKWNEEANNDMCMDYMNNHMTDKEIESLLFKYLNITKLSEYDRLSQNKKNVGIKQLLKMYIPIRQISRISGFSFNKIQNLRSGIYGKVSNLTYMNITSKTKSISPSP